MRSSDDVSSCRGAHMAARSRAKGASAGRRAAAPPSGGDAGVRDALNNVVRALLDRLSSLEAMVGRLQREAGRAVGTVSRSRAGGAAASAGTASRGGRKRATAKKTTSRRKAAGAAAAAPADGRRRRGAAASGPADGRRRRRTAVGEEAGATSAPRGRGRRAAATGASPSRRRAGSRAAATEQGAAAEPSSAQQLTPELRRELGQRADALASDLDPGYLGAEEPPTSAEDDLASEELSTAGGTPGVPGPLP